MDLKQTLAERDSCLNRLVAHEQLFVLMGRDPAAPLTICTWAIRRMQLGLNRADDKQMVEAFAVAELMESMRAGLRSRLSLEDVEPRLARLDDLESRAARDEKVRTDFDAQSG